MQHYVMKFVSDLQQVNDFLWVLWFLHHHNITKILLKVVLITVTLTLTRYPLVNLSSTMVLSSQWK